MVRVELAVWAFILQPSGETTTRLIIRFRSTYLFSLPNFLVNQALLEPIHFIMERKMLLGIKERAERAAGNFTHPFTNKAELTGIESENLASILGDEITG